MGKPADSTALCVHGWNAKRVMSANARPPSMVKSGSEFKWTHDAKDAHEQAMGWKQEAIDIATSQA